MPITALEEKHLPGVSHLHATSLAGDFLPSLGEPFLQVLYRAALRQGLAFGLVWEENDQPLGFVLASPDTSRLFREVIRSSAFALGWAALPAVLRHPGRLKNIAETFLYPAREGTVSEKAELVVIAVDAAQRGRGLGDKLVRALDKTFIQMGISSYKVTVLQANSGANRFYQRLGFQLAGQFALYGRAWNLYTLSLGDRDL